MQIENTPWGEPVFQEEVAEGIISVSTPGHGGYHISQERLTELPPDFVQTMMFKGWAEEDCEAPMVTALLGFADDQTMQYVWQILRKAEIDPIYHHFQFARAAVEKRYGPVPEVAAP